MRHPWLPKTPVAPEARFFSGRAEVLLSEQLARDPLFGPVELSSDTLFRSGDGFRIGGTGRTRVVRDAKTGAPAKSVEVVFVEWSGIEHRYWHVTADEYSDVTRDGVLCWSVNGVQPDSGTPAPQASACALCPRAAKCGPSRTFAAVVQTDAMSEPLRMAVTGWMMKMLRAAASSFMGNPAAFTLTTRVHEGRRVLAVDSARVLRAGEQAMVDELRATRPAGIGRIVKPVALEPGKTIPNEAKLG